MTETPSPAPRPHRGGLVLAFGIVGVVPCGLPFGIAAWVMANSDLAAMRRGEMDRAGHDLTRTGKICGIVGVSFLVAALAIHVLIFAATSFWYVHQHSS
jgi:hypothetical protein